VYGVLLLLFLAGEVVDDLLLLVELVSQFQQLMRVSRRRQLWELFDQLVAKIYLLLLVDVHKG